jgi:hypothetical protein
MVLLRSHLHSNLVSWNRKQTSIESANFCTFVYSYWSPCIPPNAGQMAAFTRKCPA